jgi:hypothetical protein
MLASAPGSSATRQATVDGSAPRAGGILPRCAAGSSADPIRSGHSGAFAAARNWSSPRSGPETHLARFS